jgi:catechol 2,3-dioxygenase-like lactoylglutathione lyase family enzyme
MALRRMDNILIVVEDLEAAKAFFIELGMVPVGQMPIEGPWVDRCIGIDNTRAEIAMLRTPDGHGQIELDKFHAPAALPGVAKDAPVNTLGIRRIMFAVENLDDLLARLRAHGAEVVDQVVQYEDSYRLCYVRGPEGILIGLAEELGRPESETREPKPARAKTRAAKTRTAKAGEAKARGSKTRATRDRQAKTSAAKTPKAKTRGAKHAGAGKKRGKKA